MTSVNRILFFGSSIALLSVVFSHPPAIDRNTDYRECLIKARSTGNTLPECLSSHFNEEEYNETRRLFNDEESLASNHFCRKKDVVINCVDKVTEDLKFLSNKSTHMVPFMNEVTRTEITIMCENDAALLKAAIKEDNRKCCIGALLRCKNKLESIDFEKRAFCDYTDVEDTKQFMCLNLLDFLECAQNRAHSCSAEVESVAAIIISKLRSADVCAQYY